jgi:glycosyltransferase involved in cell wall biosynthesis
MLVKNKIPKISVIISVLNAAVTFEKCLKSIISQSYYSFELIVIDGGSMDGTNAIIEKFKNHISYSLSENDSGIYDAWNKAIRAASGEWLCFIGADDYYVSEKSLEQIAELAQFPQVNFVCAKAYKVNAKGEVLNIEGKPWDENKIFTGMRISHPGSLHHRILFEKIGLFDQSFKIAADYDFFLRSVEIIKPAFLDLPILNIGNEGVSNTNAVFCLKESKRAVLKSKKYGIIKANYYFILAILKHYLRKLLSSKNL